MVETHTTDTSTTAERRLSRFRRTVTRAVVAGGITLGVLAVAGPSWASPMMGC